MGNLNMFEPDYIIPPGETIVELLEHYNMTQKELSSRLELTPKTVNEIVKGKAPITFDTAIKLENVFSVEASFWNNLEKNYREQLAELEKREKLESQIGELKKYPLKELEKKKWINLDKGTDEEKVERLLKFFGVASFSSLETLHKENKIFEGAFRIFPESKIDTHALACWVRKGEIEANKIQTGRFSKDAARDSIEDLKKLSLVTDPSIFIPKIQEVCSNFGVAVVFIPEIKGSRVSGLTRWLSPKSKAIIQLSGRYKTHDSLWFTFFHELGHLILHDKRPFVEFEKYREGELEQEANEFAANTLIPHQEFFDFVKGIGDRNSVIEFADKVQIHPGIVLGRLQKEGYIPWNQWNDLKVRYDWKNHD